MRTGKFRIRKKLFNFSRYILKRISDHKTIFRAFTSPLDEADRSVKSE